MAKQSAGILAYRKAGGAIEVLLVHPGGPFFTKKDAGVWSVPKGEFTEEEQPLAAARREFTEETGGIVNGTFIPLTPIIQKSGKKVFAWAVQHDMDTTTILSNNFSIEWPPKSGRMAEFPEVDRAAWLTPDEARIKINPAQAPLIDELEVLLATGNK